MLYWPDLVDSPLAFSHLRIWISVQFGRFWPVVNLNFPASWPRVEAKVRLVEKVTTVPGILRVWKIVHWRFGYIMGLWLAAANYLASPQSHSKSSGCLAWGHKKVFLLAMQQPPDLSNRPRFSGASSCVAWGLQLGCGWPICASLSGHWWGKVWLPTQFNIGINIFQFSKTKQKSSKLKGFQYKPQDFSF